MARETNRLGLRPDIATFEPGVYVDGNGLRLLIGEGSDGLPAKHRWSVRLTKDGKTVERGLGPAFGPNAVPIATARAKAQQLQSALQLGELDIAGRPKGRTVTLGEFLKTWWRENGDRFNPGTPHHRQWERSLFERFKPLHGKAFDEIDTDAVLSVLKPHWAKTPETASRDRSRLEYILNAAAAAGHRDGERPNPARWKGHLEFLLTSVRRKVEHHAALPWREAPSFMRQLRSLRVRSVSNTALEFCILTAARSGEVRGATYGEFDGDLWRIPGSRMKGGREHVVPLSNDAHDIWFPKFMHLHPKDGDLVFPGIRNGNELSDMALLQVLRKMKRPVTVHGFRSTFKDWAFDNRIEDNDLIEMCLAHQVGSDVERAYRRTDALERRKKVMDQWSEFLRGKS